MFKKVSNFVWEKYNQLFLFVLLASVVVFHAFPQANKFDLMEELSPVVVFAGVVFAGCLIGYLRSFLRKEDMRVGGIESLILILFTLMTGLSFYFSSVKSFGFGEVFVLLLTTSIFLYFSTCYVDESSKKVSLVEKHLPKFAVILLLLHACFGLFGYFSTDHGRFFGMFYNQHIKADAWPNAYATMFLMVFPIAIYAMKNSFNFAKYIVIGFLISLFFLTLSRAGFLAFVIEIVFVGIVLIMHFGLKNLCGKKVVGGIVLSLLSATVFFYGIGNLRSEKLEDNVVERYSFGGASGGTSFGERKEFFEGAIQMAISQPLFGFGPSSFKWVYPEFQQGFLSNSDHAHNILLKLSSERGVPAALLFLCFLAILFLRKNPFSKKTDLYVKIVWIGIVGAMAHSMVDYNFNFVSNEIFFYLTLASITSFYQKHESMKWLKIVTMIFALWILLAIAITSFKLVLDTFAYRDIDNKIRNKSAHIDQNLILQIATFQPLFPRWWFLRLDDAIAQASAINTNITSSQLNSIREILLTKEMESNVKSIEPILRLAEIELQRNNLGEARALLVRATALNPKNTFRHYSLLFFTLDRISDKKALSELKKKFEPLINEYKILYSKNIHFTQRDGEMKYVKTIQNIIRTNDI